MRKPEDFRDHAQAAEAMAALTNDHLLKTNFRQLARHWRAAAEAQDARAKTIAP